jgi:MoxR-like ATPase
VSTGAEPVDLAELIRATGTIRSAVGTVVDGKPDIVRLAVTVLLAEGHLLLEDVPGVGKTMLAKALARSIGCSVRRIQFTLTAAQRRDRRERHPQERHDSVRRAPNVVVGDDQPSQPEDPVRAVGVHGGAAGHGRRHHPHAPDAVHRHRDPEPGGDGWHLPAAGAQRDRFMARLSMYTRPPRRRSARAQCRERAAGPSNLSPTRPQSAPDATARRLRPDAVKEYVVALARATRSSADLRLGASPRAALHLLRACKAHAAMSGRDHVLPDDVQALALPVLAHRLLPSADAQLSRRSPEDVVTTLLAHVPVPRSRATA